MISQIENNNTNRIVFTQNHIKKIRLSKNSKGYFTNTIDNDILDQDSEFRMASISKLFMDITLLLMQEDNKLKVNDNVSKYIKSENPDNDFSSITLLDIMNHKSGIKRVVNDRKDREGKHGLPVFKYKNATEVMNLFINEPLFEHKHGEYSYSNIGFTILAAIIEKITGANNYSEVIMQYLLKPLKMLHTDIGETNIKLYNKNGLLLSQDAFNEIYYAAGGGGFYSSIYDMVTFAKGMPGLFIDFNLIKLLDKCVVTDLSVKKNNDGFVFSHYGAIQGGISMFSTNYTPEFKFINCKMEFETIKY